MTAWRKVMVFSPQLVGVSLTCSMISAAVWLGQRGLTVAMVPAIVIGAVSALVTGVTSVNKIDTIQCKDWDEFGGCKRCAVLERDRDELRQALLAAPMKGG